MTYKQIDYLKAFSIICVILLHTFSIKDLYDSYAIFHIWNAVPVFILLMAFTSALSFNKKNIRQNELYSSYYFINKFKRIVLPLIPIFIILFVLGKILKVPMVLGIKNLYGVMPISGYGNYYITITLKFILLSPILYFFYKKSNKVSLLLALTINFIFEYYAKFLYKNNLEAYSRSLLRYLFLIFLGFYLYDLIIKNKTPNKLIYIGFLISSYYLLIINNPDYSLELFLPTWKTQLFLSDFFPFILTYLGFKLLKFKSLILTTIGKSSYHIFLVQMVYFHLKDILHLTFHSIYLEIIINSTICIFIGYIFYKLNKMLK